MERQEENLDGTCRLSSHGVFLEEPSVLGGSRSGWDEDQD